MAAENEHLRAQIDGLKGALRAAVEESDALRTKVKNHGSSTSTPPSSSDASAAASAEFEQKAKAAEALATKARKELDEARKAWVDERAQFSLKLNLAVDEADEKAKKKAKAEFLEATKKDKEKLRNAVRERAQAQSDLASANEEVANASAALSKSEAELAAAKQSLKDMEIAAKEMQSELSSAREAAEKSSLECASSAKRESDALESADAAQKKFASLDIEHGKLLEKYKAQEKVLSEQEQLREDAAVEHKIANRRNVQMVKQLKNQLAKENKLRQKADESVKELEKQVDDLVARAEKQKQKQKQNRDAVAASNGAVPRAVVDALGKRLEGLLNENERVREQVRFLQQCVQSLTAELEEKKAAVGEMAQKADEVESQAEINKQLKKDIKIMGQELLKAQNAEVVEL